MSSGNNNGQVISPQHAVEPSPDWGTVRQVETYPLRSVPVCVEGEVNARYLPAKRSTAHSYVIQNGQANQATSIVPGDPRIKRVQLFCSTSGQSVTVGRQTQLAQPNGAEGFVIQGGLSYPPFEGFEEELFAVNTGAAAATICVWIEYGAD